MTKTKSDMTQEEQIKVCEKVSRFMWEECDEYNRVHTNGNDRKIMED